MSTASTVPEQAAALDGIRAIESQYLLQNYARYPLLLERGKGCYVFD
jgi:acetylornithine/N-succinyldiaminopimelate aminotransferase